LGDQTHFNISVFTAQTKSALLIIKREKSNEMLLKKLIEKVNYSNMERQSMNLVFKKVPQVSLLPV